MLGLPPGVSPDTPHCAQCGRRIGVHLSFPDPEDARRGLPAVRRICYRCHRLTTWGRQPPMLEDTATTPGGRPAQFIMYRLAMILVAGATFLIVRRTGSGGHFLMGLGGVIIFFALSAAVRPRRPKPERLSTRTGPKTQDAEPPTRTKET